MKKDYIKGKSIVITGISRGIGKSLAIQLADRGANVFGWGITAPDYQHEKIHFIKCEISQPDAVESALAQTLKVSERIDVLINNAGFGYFHPIKDFDLAIWQKMFDVNVTGTFLASRAVAPIMQKQLSGHIVNISSVAGKMGMPQGEGYNATKFAVTGFSEALFNELRTDGIKVTTIFPGSTATNFFDEIPGNRNPEFMMDVEELSSMIIYTIDTSPNFVVKELEMRPLNSKPVDGKA